MNLKDQSIVLILSFILIFFYFRCFLYGIKRFQLNNSAFKKRKKGESFKEWLFYSRYKEEIPKILLAIYYTVLVIHPFVWIVDVFVNFIDFSFNIGHIITVALTIIDGVLIIVIHSLFLGPNGDPKYERWIPKIRGQKRKKR